MLRKQYLDEFDWMKTVRSQDDYVVERYNMTEREYRKRIYKWGPRDSEYTRDYKAVRRVGTPVVGNFYTYIAHKLQRNTLIIDEAHTILGTLQDLAAKRIWRNEYTYPEDATNLGDLLSWLNSSPGSDIKMERLRVAIESTNPATLLRMAREPLRGTYEDCLKLIPMNVSDVPSPFWPKKVKKIVLMSATIGAKDIEMMGLSSRRILYLDVASPIDAERRPILFQPVGNMSYRTQDSNIEALAEDLIALADHHGTKGFVHAPYAMAMKLRPFLQDDPRFMFHDRMNKQSRYDTFYDLPPSDAAVMVGSGMMEGLDLKYEVADWQALVKVPYPSLADPAMRYIADSDPDYYNWQVSKDVMQASGRICRAPDDEGVTYLLDSQFKVWYNKCKDSLPRWFGDAVEGM